METTKNSKNLEIRTISESKRMTPTLRASLFAIFAVLEMVFTMVVQLNMGPGGFFHFGEFFIFTVAILFDPALAAFTGGVGSAIADIASGYGVWAPGTFVIKAIEGFVVSSLYHKIKNSKFFTSNWEKLTVVIGTLSGLILISLHFLIGSNIYFIIVGILLIVGSIVLGFTVQKDTAQMIFVMLIGGIIMVSGYFFYESLILNENGFSSAIAYIPANIFQALMGIFLAILVIPALKPIVKKFGF